MDIHLNKNAYQILVRTNNKNMGACNVGTRCSLFRIYSRIIRNIMGIDFKELATQIFYCKHLTRWSSIIDAPFVQINNNNIYDGLIKI